MYRERCVFIAAVERVLSAGFDELVQEPPGSAGQLDIAQVRLAARARLRPEGDARRGAALCHDDPVRRLVDGAGVAQLRDGGCAVTWLVGSRGGHRRLEYTCY